MRSASASSRNLMTETTGTERLGLRERGRVVDTAEHGRLDVVAVGELAADPFAAEQQFTGLLRHGVLDDRRGFGRPTLRLMTGPKNTVGSSGSPTCADPTVARNFSTNASYTESCTRTRLAQAQLWPDCISGP